MATPNNIATWLWYGGQVRVATPIETNGGVKFEVGEVLRLDRMVPYGEDTSLCGMYFVSVTDPTKTLYSGGSGAESQFEFLMNARLSAKAGEAL